MPARAIGDAGAIKRAYQAGLDADGANGGLTSIPIFDNATSNETGGYHYGWFHFALRDRLRQANGGNSDNMVMWRSVRRRPRQERVRSMDGRPTSPTRRTIRSAPRSSRARPKRLASKAATTSRRRRCSSPKRCRSPASRHRSAASSIPSYSNPRHEAGGPLAADILKCQLKPIDREGLRGPVHGGRTRAAEAIFPGGVCDWSKPGVNQTPVVPWASFGPSPKNLVFDVTK